MLEKSDLSDKFKYSEIVSSVGRTMSKKVGCCKVDAVVTMDPKGQIVLPKDIRERARLNTNDKLAVIGCEEDGEVCCIMLVKAEKLEKTIKAALGPMLKDIFRQGGE